MKTEKEIRKLLGTDTAAGSANKDIGNKLVKALNLSGFFFT